MQQLGKSAHIDQLADDIALCATRIDAATHQLLTHIRNFDEQRGWAWQSARSCAAWLSWRIGLGAGAAREKVRVANALGNFPVIDANWIGELHDGTPLRGETLKRIGCDCGLVAAKLGPGQMGQGGAVLDIGRRRRTVTSAQWRALLTRQRHCCFPGCTHAVFLEAHHVEHWFDRGETNLDNLALLCHGHHVAVHEGGFTIAWDDDGQPRFREPDGRIIERVPAPPHLCGDALATLTRQQHQAGVHIDRTTSLPNWDGSPANVGGAVEALVRRTGRQEPRGVPAVSRSSAR